MDAPTYNGMTINSLSLDDDHFMGEATIDRARQRDGSSLWAVRRGASVLNRNAEWEYEPSPSNRDDRFIANCRFATIEEAAATYKQYCDKIRRNPKFDV